MQRARRPSVNVKTLFLKHRFSEMRVIARASEGFADIWHPSLS